MQKLYIHGNLALASMALFAAAKGSGAPTPTPVDSGGYSFAEFKIPEAARAPGASGEASKLAKGLAAVPLNRSFLEAVEVPASITDPTEREKEFKALARKVTNKIGSTVRRYHKTNPTHNFALRTVNDPGEEKDGHLGVGVRVWRVEDSTEAEVAERAAKLAAAKAAKDATPPPPPPPAV